MTDNARDYVESVDTNTVAAIKTVKKFQVDIAFVLDSCKDPVAREPLKKLVEKFKYSDIVSNEATAEVEATIKTEVEELQKMLASSSTEDLVAKIDTISNLLSYRNRLCENSKTN